MTGGPGDDHLDSKIEAIREAESRLRHSLRQVTKQLQRTKEASINDVATGAAMQEFERMRKGAASALARYEREVMLFRAAMIQQLVEEQGMTFTDVGQKLNISRQMVARLYQAGKGQQNPSA